ncbi:MULTISPECIES: glucodextranase DOMON-like domain-containing protein [Deinococcus]|uniref:Glucodextranase DOMON-like domain-containing protein n=1 Tax=Deinococcus rufus TaxID=2136097 RepID=A0ABV7Z6J4_9DEIO|nr:glucodextranase DOMON-like domain-containing protein [Deinococcus sp. AB2017081]WQE96567.1 glucodextranase DOMON-like domain-containing protein [Deinococcus sp. AB2017081]
MLSLLTAAMLTIPDPAGDARGDGGYVLPTRPAISQDTLDLRSFSAQPQGQGMRLTVAFGQLGNPWNAPGGYSAGVTDIFVRTGFGGQSVLGDTGLRVRGASGWQYHVRVTGFGTTLKTVTEDGRDVRALPAPTMRVSGASLVIDAAIPPGTYAYWVTNSVYSPLSADGVLRPTTGGGASALQAGRADAPVPVDVLAPAGDLGAYTDFTVAPQGETRNTATLILAGLGLLGLLITLGATIAVWRRGR